MIFLYVGLGLVLFCLVIQVRRLTRQSTLLSENQHASDEDISMLAVKLENQVKEVALVVKRTTPKELSVEQIEFKQTVELKWKTAMDLVREGLADSLKRMESEMVEALKRDGEALKAELKNFKSDIKRRVSEDKNLLTESEGHLAEALKNETVTMKTALEKFRSDFDKKVKAEYDKAVESISFHTVEYKKTITKKRKEVSRKTKATKPQRGYRSIDEA